MSAEPGGKAPGPPPAVFLSAGEASGDEHAARLATELVCRRPGLRLAGLGGSRMAAAGVELLAGLDRLAVLGFAEVASRLPDLLRLRARVRRFLVEEGVRLMVAVDYPGFNLPLARWAHRRGIRVLYYIAPQVWAWRPGRARALAEHTDRICVVLPFETGFLVPHGARSEFVGHPLLDRAAAERPAGAGVAAGPPVLGLFPGSREQEVRRLLPIFLEAAERLRRREPELRVRVARPPHLPTRLYGRAAGWLAEPEAVLGAATAALTKSGTVTLELALAGVPMVVAYRMHPLTWQVARRLVRTDHVALANLVAGERIVPELLQREITPERLAALAAPLLRPGKEPRRRQLEGLAEVRRRLGGPGCTARVAERCLELLDSDGRTAR